LHKRLTAVLFLNELCLCRRKGEDEGIERKKGKESERGQAYKPCF
jgi:hypothetical protein